MKKENNVIIEVKKEIKVPFTKGKRVILLGSRVKVLRVSEEGGVSYTLVKVMYAPRGLDPLVAPAKFDDSFAVLSSSLK